MTALVDWASLLFMEDDPTAVWAATFAGIGDGAVHAGDAATLERSLTAGDNLLSAAAWDLWLGYATHAPMMAQSLCDWWDIRSGSAGKAVLLLDALSVREMRTLLLAAASRGSTPATVQVRGAQAPTDTDATAHVLGLAHRSQLKSSGYPASFALSALKLYTDMPEGVEFGQLVEHLPATKDIFLWCPWPDDLIHGQAGYSTGPVTVMKTATTTLSGDGFWGLVERLRQGRELLITSDHGYAISQQFVNLESPLADNLKATFKGQRCAKVPVTAFSQLGVQPMYIVIGDRASVVGPWKWKVEGGFPHLCHGGMTLAEVCVPFLLFPAL